MRVSCGASPITWPARHRRRVDRDPPRRSGSPPPRASTTSSTSTGPRRSSPARLHRSGRDGAGRRRDVPSRPSRRARPVRCRGSRRRRDGRGRPRVRVRIRVSGLRSSCDASATKRCCRRAAASTGRRVRPTSHHVRPPSSGDERGKRDEQRHRRAPACSRRRRRCSRRRGGRPADRRARSGRLSSRKSSSSIDGNSTVREVWRPSGGGATAGSPATLAVAASTSPSSVTSCGEPILDVRAGEHVGGIVDSAQGRARSRRPVARASRRCCRSAAGAARRRERSPSRSARRRAWSSPPRSAASAATAARAPSGSWLTGVVDDAVPGAAHGLDRAATERLVDAAPQPAHVDLDDVGVALEILLPDAGEDLVLRDHLSGPPHEELEHLELAGRELDRMPRP